MMSEGKEREQEFVEFVQPFFPNASFGGPGHSGWGKSPDHYAVIGVSAVILVTEMPPVDDYVKAVNGTVEISEPKLKRIKGHANGIGNCTLSTQVGINSLS